jgi:hypothetical protein
MAITFHFKAGAQQSREAGQYFSQVANELLETGLHDLEARQLVLTEDAQEPMPMRIWTTKEPTPDDLGALVPWIRSLLVDMGRLSERGSDLSKAVAMVKQWVQERHGEQSFFAEILDPAHAFTADEDNTLSIGVFGGETVMLSARNIMFIKLASDQFGLAVANKGSFLIERNKAPELVQARRA